MKEKIRLGGRESCVQTKKKKEHNVQDVLIC